MIKYWRSFPDLHMPHYSLHVADRTVIAELRCVGTHEQEYLGIPAKGNTLSIDMCVVYELSDAADRVVTERLYYDFATLREQLTAE